MPRGSTKKKKAATHLVGHSAPPSLVGDDEQADVAIATPPEAEAAPAALPPQQSVEAAPPAALLDRIKQLEGQLATSHHVKVKPPATFRERTDDLQTFVSHAEAYIAAVGGSPTQKGRALLQCIAGPAHHLLRKAGFTEEPDCALILEELKRVYGEDESPEKLRKELEQLKQKAGETFEELEVRIKYLTRVVCPDGIELGPEARRDLWIRALRDDRHAQRARKLRDITRAIPLRDIIADLTRRDRAADSSEKNAAVLVPPPASDHQFGELKAMVAELQRQVSADAARTAQVAALGHPPAPPPPAWSTEHVPWSRTLVSSAPASAPPARDTPQPPAWAAAPAAPPPQLAATAKRPTVATPGDKASAGPRCCHSCGYPGHFFAKCAAKCPHCNGKAHVGKPCPKRQPDTAPSGNGKGPPQAGQPAVAPN